MSRRLIRADPDHPTLKRGLARKPDAEIIVAQPLQQVGLSVACLLVALVGVHYWQETHQAALAAAQLTQELVEVDTQVLTGDLPIKAYLDEDFQTWLKQSSQ